jgi:hypothetical protein
MARSGPISPDRAWDLSSRSQTPSAIASSNFNPNGLATPGRELRLFDLREDWSVKQGPPYRPFREILGSLYLQYGLWPVNWHSNSQSANDITGLIRIGGNSSATSGSL